jgi:hypothetical protein
MGSETLGWWRDSWHYTVPPPVVALGWFMFVPFLLVAIEGISFLLRVKDADMLNYPVL